MPFTIPNELDAGFADQAELDSRDLAILAGGIAGTAGSDFGAGQTGVQSGCAVTAQGSPDMTVAVAAGVVRIGGRRVTVAGGNVTITAAHGSLARFDLITVNTSGTKAAVAGTAAANAAFPAITAGTVVLATVYVPATDTQINTNQITDKRVIVDKPEAEMPEWYGALRDGSTEDQTAIQAACTAAAVGSGPGLVQLSAGTYLVDATQAIGTAGAAHNAAIGVPSNVAVVGMGAGQTTVKLKAVTRVAASATVSVFINLDPNGGNANVAVRELTIDGNRLNQGPYAWDVSLAVASLVRIRGVSLWACTDSEIRDVAVKNAAEHAIFLQAGCMRCKVDGIRLTDVVGGVTLDHAEDCIVTNIIARSTDAAFAVTTTSTTSVGGGGSVVVTPASMTGITNGAILLIAVGTTPAEYVYVTAVTGSTFTAYFAQAHSGTWAINDARFPCDGVTQGANLVARCVYSNVEVDYSASLAPAGPACEIFGAKGVVVANYFTKGTWLGVWVHNWTSGGTKYMVEDVSVTGLTTVNCKPNLSGVRPVSLLVEDNGYTGVGEEARNISCAGLTSRWGKDGASIPTDANGIVVYGGNVMGFAATGIVVDSAYTGMTFVGSTEVDVSGAQIRNTRSNGIYIAGGLSRSAFSAVTIVDPGRSTSTDETPGIFMVGDAALINRWNVFSGVNIKGAGKVSPVRGAIDLSQGTAANNQSNLFIGCELSSNTGPGFNGGATSNRVVDPNSDTTLDVASAGTVTLPAHAAYFNITGTTNITSITASWASRQIVLKFAGVLTVTDGSNLNLVGNFTTVAGDTLELVCDGTDWFEIGRSANATNMGSNRIMRLGSQHSVSATTPTKVTGMDMTLEAGTYTFDYRLIVRAATAGVAPQFNFNFTGTATTANWWYMYADLSATLLAAIGQAADNVTTQTLGFQMAQAENVEATTAGGNMGPAGGLQNTATNTMVQITGLIVVTVAGNMELWHGSETATATTVEVGSSLVVVRTG